GAHLRGRRIGGHEDDGRGARELGGQRHALGVVARREADHAAPALLVGEGQELVEGSADLEGACPLQVLALEEDAVARGLVEGAAGDHGRAMDAALQPARGLPDIVDGEGIHGADYRAPVEAGYTPPMRMLTAVVASALLLQG